MDPTMNSKVADSGHGFILNENRLLKRILSMGMM